MTYDPFSRGPFPVGVRTCSFTDAKRGDRLLPTEVWYPATDEYAGRDLDATLRDRYEMLPGLPVAWQAAVRDAEGGAGVFPAIVFSHGFGGHRRQSTFLCTHFASHGYIVVAPDHTGNTMLDIVQGMLAGQGAEVEFEPLASVPEFVVARPGDVTLVLDRLLDGAAGVPADRIDHERVGMTGHSFGGWTTLAVVGRDPRIHVALPLAPAGGAVDAESNPFADSIDFNWGREVPTLFLVAERDSLLPLRGMHELLERTPSREKRMFVLENADHMHFCDQAEQIHEMFRQMPPPGAFAEIARSVPPISELCSGEVAHDFARAAGLAHMDANLKAKAEAREWLCGDVCGTLATHGIGTHLV